MPSDIRSFFGGGGAAKTSAPPAGQTTNASKPAKSQRGRKVVSDDDEDEIPTKPAKVATPKKKQSAKETKAEETTTSEYFALSKPKIDKSTPIRSKPLSATNGTHQTPTKATKPTTPSTGRRSSRKTARKNYAEDAGGDTVRVLDDDGGGNDDIFAENFKSRKAQDDYEESASDDDVVQTKVGQTKRTNGRKMVIAKDQEEDLDDEELPDIPSHDGPGDTKRKRTAPQTSSRKRKSKDLAEDEESSAEDDDDAAPKKKPRKTASAATTKKPRTTKKEDKEESKEIQKILDSIPTVRAPTPPPRDENRKFQFGGGNTNVAPPAAGSKERPVGADNCLAGLTFVFTGVLESLGRDEGQSLVKQYGGKVTTGPSSKTDYVVLGSEAGPKKLETIQKLNLKTIDEDGLFALIKNMPANGGDSKAAEKYAEKQAKEEEKIKAAALEMERRERERTKKEAEEARAAAKARGDQPPPRTATKPKVDDLLWVNKYAPDGLNAVCGNKGLVEGLQRWLHNWHDSAAKKFKIAGRDGKGIYRAALLSGPPGIGKTTAAHLVAKLEGFDIVETNASDTRSKSLVEASLRGVLDTTSLLGYFAADGKKVEQTKKKLVLIMDEVDGMSAGDRGGVGALAAVAKKTNVPMILICNERNLPKMKPFNFVTADFSFRRPKVDEIRGRIATICFREGIKLPMPIINALIEGSNADIRQIINMLSTIKLDNKDFDFDDTKSMSKAWEKHIILKPWDIVSKILRPQMFAPSSTTTLNEKIELYFNDHEFSYLMMQENYLKTQPSLANNLSGDKRNLKLLELASNAAMSISDGDLVDRMIHGSQQQWGLMPTHGVFSFVIPASYMAGNLGQQVGFAGWLGQNSKQNKLSRFIKEIQGHMRLKASGDRHEIRQQYLSALWGKMVHPLEKDGKDAVQGVIDFMDSYYLNRDDWTNMLELGVGPMDGEKVKLDSGAKAAFTRLYNSQSHPMPFVKASSILGIAKGSAAAKKDKPDLEEAVDESDGEEVAEVDVKAEEAEDDELDLKKDKYISAPKKKAAPKKAATTTAAASGDTKGKGKGKRKKAADDDSDDTEDTEASVKKKPTTSARGGKKGGRGRGKA